MVDLLIVCAMPFEAAALPPKYRVVVCGVGFQNAARVAAEAIQRYRPDVVLSVGTCGALDSSLAMGQVFSATRILSPLGEFQAMPLQATEAVLFSQDRIAATVADKQALLCKGASLVDMEAAIVARESVKAGVKFGCLKAVSDLAAEDLPLDFNRYRRADGGFNNARIALAGIMKIGGLLRLQRQAKFAAQRLGEAIDHAIANIT